MSDNGKRVASPSPSNGHAQGPGSAAGSVLSGRNRAASTAKSITSVMSGKTVTSYQLTGSKKINTAPPWAKHEPPSPDGELPSNPVTHFLGAANVVHPNDSQHLLSPTSGNPHRDGSSITSSQRGQRQGNSDVASMTSSAPDQMAELNREGQQGWWPFSLPLPPLPLPLRKNSQQGQASSLTSPFQALFSQPWLNSSKSSDERMENGDAAGPSGQADGSAGGGATGGDEENASKPKKDRPRVQWLFDRAQVRKQGLLTEEEMRQPSRRLTDEGDSPRTEEDETDYTDGEDENGNKIRRQRRGKGMHLNLPRRGKGPFTVSNSKTPGWEQPWSPIAPSQARVRGERGSKEGAHADELDDTLDDGNDDLDPSAKLTQTKRQKRSQTLRRWILYNNSVPLLIRLLNLSFTSATLAVAISIRQVERKYTLVGAVGSSPILAIIFAPLTIIHVMIAIYLEYFGKPLGLWRTSGKLMHTLLEMLFICMWSANLSLAFDNFFTSRLDCTPSWTTRWWNQLPLPETLDEGRNEGGPADRICDEQLALICLVFFGLVLYCGSLIISLFRIFEKVKSHGADPFSGRRGFGLGGFGMGRFGAGFGR